MCGAKPLRLARHKKSTSLKFTKSGTSRKSNHRETPLLRIPAPAAIVGGASSRRFYALCYSERRRSCASLRPRHTVHPEHKKRPAFWGEGAGLKIPINRERGYLFGGLSSCLFGNRLFSYWLFGCWFLGSRFCALGHRGNLG